MVVAQRSDTYWRPNRHVTTEKLVVVLEGILKILTFNEAGQIQTSHKLTTEGRCMALILGESFHTQIAGGTGSVHLEVMHGSTESLMSTREYLASAPEVGATEADDYLWRLLSHESL
jgi:cupin fold WbuC family metalloprotein